MLAHVDLGSSWRSILGPERIWLPLYLENFDAALNVHLFFSQVMVVLCLACLWICFLLVTIIESLNLETNTSTTPAVDWTRVDTYTFSEFDARSQINRNFCWWAIPAAAFVFAFWFAVFPAAEKIDKIYCWVLDRFVSRCAFRETIVTLQDFKQWVALSCQEKGSLLTLGLCFCSSPGHVIIRKSSTVEVSTDEYVIPSYPTSPALSNPNSPTYDSRKPRWSIPWEVEHIEHSERELDIAPLADIAITDVVRRASKDLESATGHDTILIKHLPGLPAHGIGPQAGTPVLAEAPEYA